jgi:hypothetical protein
MNDTNSAQVYIAFISSSGLNTVTNSGNGSGWWPDWGNNVTVVTQQNLTDFFPAGDIRTWGFECQVPRELGTHNLQRLSNNSWAIESSSFSGQIDYPRLQLAAWDLDLNFRAIDAPIAGFGPAIFNASEGPDNTRTNETGWSVLSFDFNTTMLNALYMIGETESIANEAVMLNTTGSISKTVDGANTAIFYQITYVPLVLLGAIVFAIVASCIPLILFIYNYRRNPRSFRTWRQVSVVRLVADAMAGLREDDKDKAGTTQSSLSNKSLYGWAKKLNVRYWNDLDEDGQEKIQLKEVLGH